MLTPLDSVNTFVPGTLGGGVVYNPDLFAWYMVFALGAWTAVNMFIRHLLRFLVFRKLIKGDMVLIVKNGKMNLKASKYNSLEMEHSRTILRENGVFSMFDVESARFEANGKLTISRRGSLSESFLRVNNGYLSDEALDSAGKTTGWLEEGLGMRISAVCSAWNGRRKKGSMSSQKH